MKTNLNFDDKETRKLLAKLDFEFFLKQNMLEEDYPQEKIENIYISFAEYKKSLRERRFGNSKQFYFYLEGQVRKMFTGGFLPALFHLDEGRKHTIVDFSGVGKSYAIFKQWQKHYKHKITAALIWEVIIKIGSILGIVLSIIALLKALGAFPNI